MNVCKQNHSIFKVYKQFRNEFIIFLGLHLWYYKLLSLSIKQFMIYKLIVNVCIIILGNDDTYIYVIHK